MSENKKEEREKMTECPDCERLFEKEGVKLVTEQGYKYHPPVVTVIFGGNVDPSDCSDELVYIKYIRHCPYCKNGIVERVWRREEEEE